MKCSKCKYHGICFHLFNKVMKGNCEIMTEEQAIEYLNNNYICCCPYGSSPCKCDDEKCEFGQAIRALLKANSAN